MTATNIKDVSDHIKKMKFRRKVFGGVDERDVWRQIKLLDDDYRNLYRILCEEYQKNIELMKQRSNGEVKTRQ